MKLSEFIKKYGDCEVTDKIKECIVKKPKSVWELEPKDRCYCFDVVDNIQEILWTNLDSLDCLRKLGLVKLTRQEIEFQIKKMEIYEELKRFSKDFTDEEWKRNDIDKWFIFYDCELDEINFNTNTCWKSDCLYFESVEKAEEAITAVGEERVKKYYLGVGK